MVGNFSSILQRSLQLEASSTSKRLTMSTTPLLRVLLLALLISLIVSQKQLTVGVAQQDWAPKQTLMQYKIDSIGTPIAGTNKEIIFIVTPFSGDADVYVKISGPPSTTDFDLKAADTGADYIWINSTSPFAAQAGPFYVGVYAHKSDVTFSVLVYVTDSTFKLRTFSNSSQSILS
jgi:hypothetical protein